MDMNILDTMDLYQLGQELSSARKKRGMTQEEAADILGVSRTTITAIEAGNRRIKPGELIKLARAYGIPVHDLVRPRPQIEPFSVQFRGPHLRAVAVEDEEKIKKYVDELEDLCRDYLEVEHLTNSPLATRYPPEVEIAGHDIALEAEVLADQERRRLGLGDGPVPNVRALLEQEVGLRIFYLPMEPRTYSAMYLYDHQLGGCIGVNSYHPEERRRWSMIHDYLHFLAHRFKPALFVENRYRRVPEDERLADYFAGFFLMPTSSLLRQYNRILREDGTITPAGLCTLAAYYGVSVAAITLRLEDIGKLPAGTWDMLRDSGFKVREAQQKLGIEPIAAQDNMLPLRYQYLAVYGYEEGLISEGELAHFLRVGRVQAREIVESLRRHSEGITDDRPLDLDLTQRLVQE